MQHIFYVELLGCATALPLNSKFSWNMHCSKKTRGARKKKSGWQRPHGLVIVGRWVVPRFSEVAHHVIMLIHAKKHILNHSNIVKPILQPSRPRKHFQTILLHLRCKILRHWTSFQPLRYYLVFGRKLFLLLWAKHLRTFIVCICLYLVWGWFTSWSQRNAEDIKIEFKRVH